jgi:hypothetical protein
MIKRDERPVEDEWKADLKIALTWIKELHTSGQVKAVKDEHGNIHFERVREGVA